MSSHHIVRDDQEPALLVLHLDQHNLPIITSLLEWSPIVIANQRTAEQLITLDIKVDWVMVTDDSQEEIHELMRNQHPYKVKNIEKGEVEAGLEWLVEEKHNAVNVIKKQYPASEQARALNEHNLDTVVLFDDHFKAMISKKDTFEKWMREGQVIRVLSASSIENLIEKEDHFQVKENGMVKIKAKAPYFVYEKWG
ncbi:aminoacyl-tRNA hydrolase [Flammeovirga pacifica]|uniref:Thiamine pyrophosphokinase n=1 Tax=Flammeovirga pacifica TaxID=915059 RepID=A0A1S1YVF8_FLAPC|nr:hypothetical protein [Flammeovirga pacifica]OHX64843.1 hypothetical protein NH26_00050 [Flammeovirga pacifica]